MTAMKLRTLIAAVAGWAALISSAGACTTFCFERNGSVVFGKNYDFGIGYGMLVVNKRGVAKASRIEPPDRPAHWTSRYGSVTFNQFGREFPSGGMNESGLVVELMWLDASQYPPPDSRPAVGVLEWIQYQLDQFATAAEVVANDLRSLDRPREQASSSHYDESPHPVEAHAGAGPGPAEELDADFNDPFADQ